MRTSWMRIAVSFFWLTLALGSLVALVQAQVSVTTWHNDNLRTGQNINETVLTPSNLSTSNFGQLCSAGLDGQVYAQPLVMASVTFNGTYYSSLVYVVTEMNTLYVIDGTPTPGSPCAVLASLSLNPAGQYPAACGYLGGGKCYTIAPVLGALGTPVIRTATTAAKGIGTLYVVTETQDTPSGMPSNWYHYLHAVDLEQLAELTGPVRVFPPGFSSTQASVWSHSHIQRPGLLYVGNYIYAAFSMMDGNLPAPNGSVFGYNAANLNAQPLYFPTTPDGATLGGGVWQGGAGLAYGPDDSGTNYIYFNTGNGNWDGSTMWGDSFVKLDPSTLAVPAQGYFTPADQSYRNCADPYTDLDFGSGGVLLTPASSYWPYLAFSGEKEGGIWAMDRLNPGTFNLGQCTNGCNSCSPANQDASNQNVQTLWLGTGSGPEIHNNPAYWNNYIYFAPSGGKVFQFQLCNNFGSGQPLCTGTVVTANYGGIYGATPAVSASSASTNGILWTIGGNSNPLSTNAGVLSAFNATTMTTLYVSSGSGSPCPQVDTIAPATKFSVPTIANGYLYLGTQALQDGVNSGAGTFYIFGLNRQCTGQIRRSGPMRKVSSGSSRKR